MVGAHACNPALLHGEFPANQRYIAKPTSNKQKQKIHKQITNKQNTIGNTLKPPVVLEKDKARENKIHLFSYILEKNSKNQVSMILSKSLTSSSDRMQRTIVDQSTSLG